MKKKLLKVLGGVVVASPLIVMLVISINSGYIMPLVFGIFVSVAVLATTCMGIWLISLSEANDSDTTKE